MFATGIENSIPTIDHGKTRVDEMAVCGHYDRWREDFDCVQEIGINYLRYGPPIYKTYLGPGKFDWEFADLTFADLKRRDITPIVDRLHTQSALGNELKVKLVSAVPGTSSDVSIGRISVYRQGH